MTLLAAMMKKSLMRRKKKKLKMRKLKVNMEAQMTIVKWSM